jgi:hypothetical protein
MADYEWFVLLAAVACELILMAFIFCIGRFYALKFKENTYSISFLIPAFVLIAILAFSSATGTGLEWGMLFTNACTLLVLMTAGLFLYKKMMGVSR